MRRRSCGAPRSWRLRGGRCPWPIGRSCRTLGDRVSLSGQLGSGGWRLGPVRGGRNGTVLARVVGVCSVWVVLLCLCLYARQSHGILTVRGMGWWHAHRARRGRSHCSVDDGGRSKCDSHFFTAASSLSLLCACLRLTWRPPPGCLVHVSGLVEPAPLRVVDAPNLPASEVDSTRPLFLPWYRGGPIGACPHLKRCAPPVSLSACHGAGGGAPGRCVSPEPVLSPPSR